jgi:hypothetical protein
LNPAVVVEQASAGLVKYVQIEIVSNTRTQDRGELVVVIIATAIGGSDRILVGGCPRELAADPPLGLGVVVAR